MSFSSMCERNWLHLPQVQLDRIQMHRHGIGTFSRSLMKNLWISVLTMTWVQFDYFFFFYFTALTFYCTFFLRNIQAENCSGKHCFFSVVDRLSFEQIPPLKEHKTSISSSSGLRRVGKGVITFPAVQSGAYCFWQKS